MYRNDELAHYGVKGMKWHDHKFSNYEIEQQLRRRRRLRQAQGLAPKSSPSFSGQRANQIDFRKLGSEKKPARSSLAMDHKTAGFGKKSNDKKLKNKLAGELVATSSKSSKVSDVKKKNPEAYLEAEHRIETALSKKTFGKAIEAKKIKMHELGSDSGPSNFGKAMDSKKKKKTFGKNMSAKK